MTDEERGPRADPETTAMESGTELPPGLKDATEIEEEDDDLPVHVEKVAHEILDEVIEEMAEGRELATTQLACPHCDGNILVAYVFDKA